MAAVVRVKRRRDELAADSFVLVSKRQRLDEYGQTDNVHNVFKFAGTLSSKVSFVFFLNKSHPFNISYITDF